MSRDNWQLSSGVIPKRSCESLIDTFSKLEPVDGVTYNTQTEIRKSKIRWIHNEPSLEHELLSFVNEANAVAFNVDIQQEMREMQFTEYHADYSGRYDWHHDVNWENHKNFDRKLSIVVQLSDPNTYEGGRFEFSEVETPKYEEFRKQGSILIFPSYLLHRVTAVTKGVRYSLVSWVRGPRWR